MALTNINPTTTHAWKQLIQHKLDIKSLNLKEEFKKDNNRSEKFSIKFKDILFDYSKNLINEKTLSLLINLANETQLKTNIEHLFNLDSINITANAPAVHTIFRSPKYCCQDTKVNLGSYNIANMLNKIESLSSEMLTQSFRSYSNKPIKNIVCICIGGSLLGIQMVCKALHHLKTNNLNLHFISNIDSHHFINSIEKIDIETSIFIVISKTFTTIETLTNAETIKNWIITKTNSTHAFQKIFFAITSNKNKPLEFGIKKENIFIIPEETNGRFSLWSSLGLIISLYVGFDNFKMLLKGAADMDDHFRYTPFYKNMAVIAALINIWYTNFNNVSTSAIIPYDDRLSLLPSYLQQLVMESNGKSVDRCGFTVNYNTSPIIWGDVGTNAQHSFFQLLHQGTQIVPCDFLASATNETSLHNHHQILLANLIGQINTLSFGNNKQKRVFEHIPGNKPSNILIFKKLTPETLGSILTFYEHKTFVEGSILNIYSFDQFGVEAGKKLAKEILDNFNNDSFQTNDILVNTLIKFIKKSDNSCAEKII